VYLHIKEVLVERGDHVKAKQKIGVIYTNPKNNQTSIQFQIWKGKKKLDPANWISKK
jgi:murein DD-endopeptidase MepM/ murein hydrolase activator NlpD